MVHKRGLTLVELLVAIAIVIILFGLVLPAVQQVRAGAARTKCASNLHQIGLAVHRFHDTYRVFPASGWTRAGPGNPNGKFVGWRAICLPFVEQADLRQKYDTHSHWWEGSNPRTGAVRIPLFECPSAPDRAPSLHVVAKPPRPALALDLPLAPADYEAIMGVRPTINPQLYATTATNRAVMFRDSRVRIADIQDGCQRSILVVECAARPRIYLRGGVQTDFETDQGQGWIDSEGGFSLDGANAAGTVQGGGPLATPVAMNATNDNEPYAFHAGGSNVLFADGHVEFVKETIDLAVFAALCTRRAREISLDWR